ncbi:uncharacterized protein LAESUDRAFT_760373 [Laetiporus sulphureus 93-53]|uniref:Retrotransposon gag domain-containing protein n=1 Tax=Laetiporus sulphureus 93-53 TaxID=1314785 RepID=A0A165DMC0_9APHY|nr:uncharacterized protein LAESUDRAFT_760373 [Laetiporus sulphureus 93-53]KZT05192.1 hypothetical protein LAESUDRAFT_760373 [Laetiporus sulphureus 93-53]
MEECHERMVKQLKGMLKKNTVTSLEVQLDGNQVLATQEKADTDAKLMQADHNLCTLHSHLVTLKNAQNTITMYIQQLEQHLMSGQVASTTSITPQPRSSQQKLLKMPKPPKFSDKGSSLTLEQWIKKVQIWLNYNQVNTDKQHISQANALLEGGTSDYMEEYNDILSANQDPGTWADFVKKLEMGYKMLDPKRTAQAKLGEHCKKKFSSMIDFVKKFRSYAPQSGYSDEDLIVKIRKHHPIYVQGIMSNVYIMTLTLIPNKWKDCLDMALRIESEYKQQLSRKKPTNYAASTSKPKDPNEMDTTARVAHNLTPEQMKIRALEEAIHALKVKKVADAKKGSSGSKGKAKASTSSEESEQDTCIIEWDELEHFAAAL